MKRLLVISSAFPPNNQPGTQRIIRFVKHLKSFGWDIIVLTLDPAYYLEGTLVDPQLLKQVPGDITVYRTNALRILTKLINFRNRFSPNFNRNSANDPTTQPSGNPTGYYTNSKVNHQAQRSPSIWQFIKDTVSDIGSVPDRQIGWFWVAVCKGSSIIRKHDIDLIYTSAPPFTCHLIGKYLQKRHKTKWVADFRDPWSRDPWGKRNLSWKKYFNVSFERKTVHNADAIVLNTSPLCKDFHDFYGDNIASKFYTITNGYDADIFKPYVNEKRKGNGKLILTHTGSLYGKRNPKPFLEALAAVLRDSLVSDKIIRVNFVGNIAPRFNIYQMLKDLNLVSIVNIIPPVPHQESLNYIANSDIMIIIQPDAHLQIPVKFFEYIAMKKPILSISPKGAVTEIIEEGNLGLISPPNDVDTIAKKLVDLYNNRDKLDSLFYSDKSYIEQYEGKTLSCSLDKILSNLL